MPSQQTLTERERRLAAAWAADSAEHVLRLFEAERPYDPRVRNAIERAREYSRGELNTSDGIRRRFGDGSTAHDAKSPAGAAAARAAGQAMAVCHMGAHALGAAGYAAKAAALASPKEPQAGSAEVTWQLAQMSDEVRVILRTLPALGQDRSGPLGPGLLTSGEVGRYIRELQVQIAAAR